MLKQFLIIVSLCLIPAAYAQTTGELHGVVKGSNDQALPGARVTARSEVSALARNTETDAEGGFVFTSIPVGQYTVEVEAEGFKSYVQQYLDITLGHVVNISVKLEAGESTQVLALETPIVERTSSQLGSVVDSKSIVSLPLNTRDAYQLLQLQPGVQSQQGNDMFAGSDNAGVVSVNGGRARANNFSVNGGDANDLFLGLPTVQPSPDSIEEFRVLTNMFDAEFGRNSGSIINVVTKAGSNDFHGNAFEFLRNKALNTRGFFDTEKPKFNQNQYGGTAGGPDRQEPHVLLRLRRSPADPSGHLLGPGDGSYRRRTARRLLRRFTVLRYPERRLSGGCSESPPWMRRRGPGGRWRTHRCQHTVGGNFPGKPHPRPVLRPHRLRSDEPVRTDAQCRRQHPPDGSCPECQLHPAIVSAGPCAQCREPIDVLLLF